MKKKSPSFFFNQKSVSHAPFQRDLGRFLDIILNISEHIKTIIQNTNKTLGLLRKLLYIYNKFV